MRIARTAGIVGMVVFPVAAAAVLSSSSYCGDVAAPAQRNEDGKLGQRRYPPMTTSLTAGSASSESRRIVSHQRTTRSEDPRLQRSDPTPHEMSTDELRASIERRFQADQVDRDETARARQQLEAHLTGALPASSVLRAVECRASICRAEVEQVDLAAHQAFLQAAISSGAGWEGPAMGALESRSDPGLVVTVVYFGRTASSLADTVPAEMLHMATDDSESR
jgi:hypothetical protein